MVSCPVCQSAHCAPFLSRTLVPVHQNLVMEDERSARALNKGELAITHCNDCGFVFNARFDPHLLSYGQHYDNTQEYSSVFKEHIQSLASYLINDQQVREKLVVEVGCGKGGFLKLLIEDPLVANHGYGFDPTYVGPDVSCEGRLKFEKCFYDERAAHLHIDVVICRHVIEHIQKPTQFLQTIKRSLGNSPHVRLFFETPCLEWILKNHVVWDFFYEHCSYFTKDSLRSVFERAGFHVDSVSHVFEGQYLWLEASLKQSPQTRAPTSTTLKAQIEKYRAEDEQRIREWKEKIDQLKARGKVALWGAGAKGVTFANLIDPKRELIDCIIDINPKKQNHFLPGSAHPIVSHGEAYQRGVKSAFVMNENYREENNAMLKKESIPIELISSWWT